MANPYGKRRTVDTPYAVYEANGWRWSILKLNQSPEKARENPYASAFCAVSSPHTYGSCDYGDTYLNDIGGAHVSGADILAECGRR